MKMRFFILILLAIVILVFGGMKKAEVKEIDDKIKEAEKCFFSMMGRVDNPTKGFKLLLEAIEMAAPHTGFSPEFKDKIVKVRKLSKETSILNPEGFALLDEAYRSINSGKAFEIPESISKIEDAVAYCHSQIETARKDLKQGNYNNSVKLLLETCLMIVTPFERKK